MVVGVFGIVGNVTSIFILSKIAAQSFFDSLLIALTSIDTIFIVFTVIDYSFARGKHIYVQYSITKIDGRICCILLHHIIIQSAVKTF